MCGSMKLLHPKFLIMKLYFSGFVGFVVLKLFYFFAFPEKKGVRMAFQEKPDLDQNDLFWKFPVNSAKRRFRRIRQINGNRTSRKLDFFPTLPETGQVSSCKISQLKSRCPLRRLRECLMIGARLER
jgi:hypothetical protein